MLTLSDIVGKTYVSKGAFNRVEVDNSFPKNSIKFKAINEKEGSFVEGILIDMNYGRDQDANYKVQLTGLKFKDHYNNLIEARKELKKQFDPEQSTFEDAVLEHETRKDIIIECYSGKIVQNIPIITKFSMTIGPKKFTSLDEAHNIAYNFNVLTESFLNGFTNILCERKKNMAFTYDKSSSSQSNKNSVVIGIYDDEFITTDLAEDPELPKIKKSKTGKTRDPCVVAAHIRNYRRKGSIESLAIGPSIIRGSELTQEQKQEYYLGPNGEISQETIKTKKVKSLQDEDIKQLIAKFDIPTFEELYKKN